MNEDDDDGVYNTFDGDDADDNRNEVDLNG